ncbi:MAG: hypothetical protein E7016_02320 [Alphaproteobacteria bacterium]|nr:hypothetical protein [Alphaproteobacteria bacterium]
MRKYFLTSAVALLSISTANATTDYAEVTAKATIEVAGKFECDEIDFGKIVVKQNNAVITLDDGECFEGCDDLISIDNTNIFPDCTVESASGDTLILENENGDTMELEVYGIADYKVYYTTLQIPAKVTPGEYTGSITVTHAY